MKYNRVTVSLAQMSGVPCIRGLRIPLSTVVGMVAESMTMEAIIQAYPDLTPDDIKEALHFAADAVERRAYEERKR